MDPKQPTFTSAPTEHDHRSPPAPDPQDVTETAGSPVAHAYEDTIPSEVPLPDDPRPKHRVYSWLERNEARIEAVEGLLAGAIAGMLTAMQLGAYYLLFELARWVMGW